MFWMFKDHWYHISIDISMDEMNKFDDIMKKKVYFENYPALAYSPFHNSLPLSSVYVYSGNR